MSSFRVPSAALLLVVAGVFAAPPSKEQITKWVLQLGSDEFDAREEASKRLWEAGEAAEEAVREAAKSSDAEVARRARVIHDKFKWGIYADTPPPVVNLINRFQTAANPNERSTLAGELLTAGWPGSRAVLKIAASTEDAAIRAAISSRLSTHLIRVVPHLLKEGRTDTLEQLLEAARHADERRGTAHYVAYWLSRGQLDERIRHHQEAAEKTKDKKEHLTLAYLHRAKGDLAAAWKSTEKAERPDLVEAILYEAGDWKELLRRGAPVTAPHPIEKLGIRAAYQRLGGDDKGMQETLNELRKELSNDGPNEMRMYLVAKALFLNDRPAEALELLGKGERHRLERFEVLCAQSKFREAIEDAEKAVKLHSLPALDIAMARTLYGLGEKNKAVVILDGYIVQIKEGTDAPWFATLIETEYRLGLHDRAFEHFARLLTIAKDQGWPTRLFPMFFPNKSGAAEVWWGILRARNKGGTPVETLKQLRDLLGGKLPAKEVTQLIEEATIQSRKHPDSHYLALAEAAWAADLDLLARKCLEQATMTPAGSMRLGDLLAGKKQWEEASQMYRRAWEKAPHEPLGLFLAGRALIQGDKEKDGRKLIDQAHLLPLGDEDVRIEFAQALSRRGEHDDARREYELVNRVSEPGGFQSGEARRRLASDAAWRKEWTAAADGQEQAMLRCLRVNVGFQLATAYVSMPALAHRLRASAALAADKIEDARREIALCQAAQPGNVEAAINLVPELERKGHKKDAADLYEQTLIPWEKVCDDYPRCAEGHNTAAWLSACCRRNLDTALAHALKAIELEPASAGFHDTLAEIYFQRGDKEKAIAAQKKAVELNPKRAYFRKQLKRIEAGDPTTERPRADE